MCVPVGGCMGMCRYTTEGRGQRAPRVIPQELSTSFEVRLLTTLELF